VTHSTNLDRRTLLKLASAGAVGSIAGCLGGNGNGNEDWEGAVEGLNLGEDWRARRIGAADDWPIEQRRQVPDRQNDTT